MDRIRAAGTSVRKSDPLANAANGPQARAAKANSPRAASVHLLRAASAHSATVRRARVLLARVRIVVRILPVVHRAMNSAVTRPAAIFRAAILRAPMQRGATPRAAKASPGN